MPKTALHRFSILLMSLVCLAGQPGQSAVAADYYPDHPVVQEMVEKAIQYIETADTGAEGTQGEIILIAVAVQKVRGDAEHPIVKRGLQVAEAVTRRIERSSSQNPEHSVYEASVAALLFCAVDANAYRPQLTVLHNFFMQSQRPYGAFGYLTQTHLETGDTSQTQYAILALWTMDQAGIETDEERIEPLVRWLLQTQDPTGGWGYQGIISRGALVNQTEVRHTLTAAGLGSMLMGGDMLGFYRNRRAEAEEEYVPKSFRRVIELPEGKKKKNTTMQREELDPTLQRALNWFSKNPYPRSYGWHYYYVYSEERMQSFIEIANGKQQKSPAWYNRGVEQLKKDQAASGGWGATLKTRYKFSQSLHCFCGFVSDSKYAKGDRDAQRRHDAGWLGIAQGFDQHRRHGWEDRRQNQVQFLG